MTKWRLECSECGSLWVLPVSYRLGEMRVIYHYCRNCRRNTFHRVVERIS